MRSSYNRSIITGALSAALLLLAMLLPGSAGAQSFSFPVHERSELKTAAQMKVHHLPDSVTVRSDSWLDMAALPTTWGTEFKIKSVNDIVKLYVDHAYPLKAKFAYTYRLCYRVVGYRDTTAGPVSLAVDTLTIGYDPDSLKTYQDMQLKRFTGYHKIIVIFTDLYQLGSSGTLTHILIDTITSVNFSAEASIQTQRYNKKKGSANYYGSATSATLLTMDDSLNLASDYVQVRWNIPGTSPKVSVPIEPVNFELEWTFVDDYKKNINTGAVTAITAANTRYSFINNSSRVWLSGNAYRIPLIYQRGYLIYRVRMVRPDSINYQYPVYSQWNVADSGTGVSALISSHNCSYLSGAHLHDSLNWQYTISFAEDGKYKHVLSYFDGMLKNRQSITRFNSTPDQLIATGQVYDYEGRPAISILPTPVASTQFRYQRNLSINDLTTCPTRRLTLIPSTSLPARRSSRLLNWTALRWRVSTIRR